MKRSEVIKKIVAESYEARRKALNEADKNKPLTQMQPDAPTAPAAATSTAAAPASSAAGAASSGGAAAIVKVRQLVRANWAAINEGDKFFAKKKDAKEKNPDKLFFRVEDEEAAEKLKAEDPTYIDPPDEKQKIRETQPVDLIEREVKEDPFGKGPELIVPEKELEKVPVKGDPEPEYYMASDDYVQEWDKGVEIQDQFEKKGDEAVLIQSFNDKVIAPPPNGLK